MGKIIILDQDIINKIAAGEVIERPASVVKELIDNSRDAEASCIRIELVNGGKNRITVIDDGGGMSQDDVFFATELHATSKVTSIEDLYSISTLGFRGEALSAIAGVSKFSLASKQKGTKGKGMKIEIHGGEIIHTDEWDGPEGTIVTCEDLFFELPARKVFLKSAMTEYSYCSEYIQAMSLADPKIHYILSHNGKETLNIPTYVNPQKPYMITEHILRQRATHVIGEKITQDMIYFKVQGQYANIYGLISPPGISKASSKMLYTYVNKRWVNDKVIKSAILTGYLSYIPKGQYPIVIIHIDIDPSLVDVNVHPAKTEIRFQYNQEMYQFISSTIKNTIRQGSKIIEGVYGTLYPSEFIEKTQHIEKLQQEDKKLLESIQNIENDTNKNNSDQTTNNTTDNIPNNEQIKYDKKIIKVSFDAPISTPFDEEQNYDLTLNTMENINNDEEYYDEDDEDEYYDEDDEDEYYDEDKNNVQNNEKVESHNTLYLYTNKEKTYQKTNNDIIQTNNDPTDNKQTTQDLNTNYNPIFQPIQAKYAPTVNFDEFQFKHQPLNWKDLKFIGSLYKCYLIFEGENAVIFIDQHAFHERIIYEKLLKKTDTFIKKQKLIVPISFEITQTEAACLEEAKNIFEDLNFEYNITDQTRLNITAIPIIFKNTQIQSVIQEICTDIEQEYIKEPNIEKITHKILSTMACKSAIKAGEEIDSDLINVLINHANEVDFFHNCPHGRRVIKWFTKTEIEKWFGR